MQRSFSTIAALSLVAFLCGIARSAENGLVASLFDDKNFTNRRVVRVDSQVDYQWGSGSPAPEIGPDTFSIQWDGQVEAPADGEYVFHTYSDDGVRLWLDDVLIVDNWTDHSPTENSSAAIALTAGQRCSIRLQMYEQGGGAVMSLRWTPPGGAKAVIPATQFYLPAWYVNPPTVTGTVPADGGSLNVASPSVSIAFSKPMDKDSVEAAFTMGSVAGTFVWSNETLTFTPVTPLPQNATLTVTIGVGARDQAGNGMTAPYAFTVLTGAYHGFVAQYFDQKNLTEPKLARLEPKIDWNWGTGSPAPQIGADTFSASWTGQIIPRYTEDYTLSTVSDDGIRLWANGALVIDNWTDHSAKEDTCTIALTAGQKYDVCLQFYENGGYAQAKLSWASASQAKEIIPAECVEAPTNLTPPSPPENLHLAHLADRVAVLAWALPADGTPVSGFEIFRDGKYLASTSSLEYRDAGLTPATSYCYAVRSVSPVGGTSSFAAPVTATTLAPVAVGTGTGLLGKYYDTIDFHDRLVVRTDPNLDFNWGTGVPAAPIGADTFSIVWAGKLQPQYSEQYTIYTLSDDGVAVWINGQLVVDNWTDHAAKEDKGTITLQAGQQYDIRVHYYENTGNTRIALLWESMSQPKEVVPTTQLYPAEFLAGAEVRLLTSEASAVSPAWVEGKTSEEANVTYTLNSQTLPAGRLDAETWYVDTASAQGLPFGVALEPQNATLLNVTANDGAGNTKTVGYTLLWSPTKLNGREWSEEILLRKGDSLLFMVSGDPDAAPPTGPDPKVEIVVAGTSTETLTGDIGQKFPHQFTAPGTYLITGRLCGVEVGSLTVKVLAVDLHVPIAAVLNYQRELDVYVQPTGQANQVAFLAANQTELTVGTKTVSTSGATLTLKPRVLTDSPLIARIGGANGPMIGLEKLEVFKMESLNNKLMAFTLDKDDFGTGVLRFKITPRTVIANDKPETPEEEGLFFDLTVRGSGICFEENGQTKLRVLSTRENEDGIISVRVVLSPNGTFTCHDVDAVQVNSNAVVIGDGMLNNPPIVEAKGGLYLVRELSDEVERTAIQLNGIGEPNLEPANNPNGKQIYQVWDRDGTPDRRWTDQIELYPPYSPGSLETAFWPGEGGKIIDEPSPNRWFTVKVSGTKLFNTYVTKFELSKTFPPIGGDRLEDNSGFNRDEIVKDEPGHLSWGADEKPIAYPAINQTPNHYIYDFDAEHNTGDFTKEYESWDKEPWQVQTPPLYTDLGFFKGNMFGYMDVRIFADVCTRLYDITLVSETRPHTEYQSTDLYGDHEENPNNAVFPDLVSVGRLEADGYKGGADKSSRDRFPDVVGANVYEVPSNPGGPFGTDLTHIRTEHVDMKGTCNPRPVQITFRAAPGERVTAAISIAEKGGANDGKKTHKAWVSESAEDIYEYQGQPGDSPEVKAGKVFKVTGFDPLLDAAGNQIGLDLLRSQTEPAERVVTFDMVADGNGFAAKVLYVYGIEQTEDRLDELKLVVWGEEWVGWKAKEIGDQTHQHQNSEEVKYYKCENAIYRWFVTDEEPLNVIRADLDIDSDNNNGLSGPNRTPEEDMIEDDENKPGKYVYANMDDSDGDGIPDFADGFDWDEVPSLDDNSLNDKFVLMKLEVFQRIDLDKASLRLTYSDPADASDPAGVTRDPEPPVAGIPTVWRPAPGKMRIWTKDANFPRKKFPCDGQPKEGHYVPPKEYTDLKKLGLTNASRVADLFVEGISASDAMGRPRILVEIDPDGDGPEEYRCWDAVRVTIVGIDLDVDTDRNGTVDEDADDSGEEVFVNARGAMIRVNCDNDGPPPDGRDPLPDNFIGGYPYLDGQNANEDSAINGADDLADLAPLVLQQIPYVPDGHTVWLLTTKDNADKRLRVFDAAPVATAAVVLGPGTGTIVSFRGDSYRAFQVPTADITAGALNYRVEAMVHPGVDFNGNLDVLLVLVEGTDLASGTVVCSDTVRLKVTPWLLNPNTAAAEACYFRDYPALPAHRMEMGNQFEAQMEAVVGAANVRKSDIGDIWHQDEYECGFSSITSSGTVTPIPTLLNLPRERGLDQWVRENLIGPLPDPAGTATRDRRFNVYPVSPGGSTASISYGGNIEVAPPYAGFPYGRIVMGIGGGETATDVTGFFTAQRLQAKKAGGAYKLIEPPTGWLSVAHMDEYLCFIPSGTAGNNSAGGAWRLVVGDPALGTSVLTGLAREDAGRSPTAVTPTTITVAGAPWAVNRWQGGIVFVTAGMGAGTTRYVMSNTADTLTIAGAWAIDATSVIRIVEATAFGGMLRPLNDPDHPPGNPIHEDHGVFTGSVKLAPEGDVRSPIGQTAQTLTVAGAPWVVNNWRGGTVTVTTGGGPPDGPHSILSNTVNSLSIAGSWSSEFTPASVITINGRKETLTDATCGAPGLRPVWPADRWTPVSKYGAPDEAHNGYVRIVAGAGVGQIRQIFSHTGNSITVRPDFTVAPDATSVYVVTQASLHWENGNPAFVSVYDLVHNTGLAGGAGLALGDAPLTDDLRAKQLLVQARVNDGLNTVTTEVGLTAPTDIVRFPQWFMGRVADGDIDKRSGVAYWPGVANMQVWNNHLLIPEPFGPRNAVGGDAIKAAIQANLPAGLTAHYIDCWRNYHVAYGEVHCGSQVRRTPPAGMLNWWNDWPVADDQ